MNRFDRAPHRLILNAVARQYGIDVEYPRQRDIEKVRGIAFQRMQLQESWNGIFPSPLYEHRVIDEHSE
jgi:hypothetical protein